MTWRGRIRHGRKKQLAMSASLPDVSGAGLQVPPPLPPPPQPQLLSSPAKTTDVKYNIDDSWADNVDSSTGSIFYLDTPSAPPPRHHEESPQPPHSSSSSSLSSICDLPPHSLPTYIPHGSPNLSDRLTHSLRVQQQDSPSSPDEHFHFSRSISFGTEKSTSVRKKISKMVRRSLRLERRGIGSTMSPSGSVPSLIQVDGSHQVSPTLLQVPRTTLYGSSNIPLSHAARNITNVRIDLAQFHLGAEGTPCSLDTLGIVPTRSHGRSKFGSLTSLSMFKPHYPTSTLHPVVIRGIAPTSPAAVTQQLHPGDIISAVNGHSVDLENINLVLGGLSDEVVFTVHTPSSSPAHHPHAHTHTHTHADLAQFVAGAQRAVRSHTKPLLCHAHILLYLTLDTEEDDPPEKDILYRYPSPEPSAGELWSVDRLAQLRGVFLTLSDVLGSISMATSSCSTILLDDQLVHLGYRQYGKELLLLALPARFASQYQVQLLVKNVERILQLLYGSVNKPWMNPETHSTLDHLFSLMFDSLLSPPSAGAGPSFSLPGQPATPQLKLPTNIKLKLSMALNELGSADHCSRPEILHVRRPFLLTGTCMFYKGALMCSHMCEEDLGDVVTFCSAYRLLELTAKESISQIVIWREVYLTSAQNQLDRRDLVYTETRGRCFLLIVGMGHVLLCMLMEQSHSTGQTPPTMDAEYVKKGRTLILELMAQDLLAQCEGRGPLPSITSADVALASLFSTSAPKRLSLHPKIEEGSDSEEGGNHVFHDSPKSGWRSKSHLLNPQQFKSRRTDFSALNHLQPYRTVLPARPAYMLTSGLENTLLHYVALHPGRGVMVCPTHATPPGPVHAELVQSFRQTSVAVREVLRGRVEGERPDEEEEADEYDSESDEEQGTTGSTPHFSLPRSSVIEHGVMLQCCAHHTQQDKQRNIPTLNYWIVGRLFPANNNLELYVCYQENMSQNIVEMAFTLLFGWTG